MDLPAHLMSAMPKCSSAGESDRPIGQRGQRKSVDLGTQRLERQAEPNFMPGARARLSPNDRHRRMTSKGWLQVSRLAGNMHRGMKARHHPPWVMVGGKEDA
jgi:hypothetical protein